MSNAQSEQDVGENGSFWRPGERSLIAITSIEDLLALKAKGFYRIRWDRDRYRITVCSPGEPEEAYFCATPGLANQLRLCFSDLGMTGYVEGSL